MGKILALEVGISFAAEGIDDGLAGWRREISRVCADRIKNEWSRYDGALRWVTEAVLGAFFTVYRELGYGYLESVYEAATAITLREMKMHVDQQVPQDVHFRGEIIGTFKIDLLVESAVAVEIKAARALDSAHEAQLLNYLRASRLEVGLLLNFGQRPSFKRLAYANERKTWLAQTGSSDLTRKINAGPVSAPQISDSLPTTQG